MLSSARPALRLPGPVGPRALPLGRAFFSLRIPDGSSVCPQPQELQQAAKAEPQSMPTREDVCKQLSERPSMMSALPFAVVSTAMDTTELYGALSKGVDIYLVLLTVRVLLTWFRTINWQSEPFKTLRTFTDPYLNMFRGILPSMGGMDLSPMLGFFVLQFVSRQLRKLAMGV